MKKKTRMNDSYLNACEQNELSQVVELLSRGADVNWRGDDGARWSGLYFAAVVNNEQLLELLLAQSGVDVNIRTNEGRIQS